MEKLIELLNDYEKWKWEEYWRWNYVWGIDKENKNIFASRFPDWAYICEEESRAIIICKGYDFIKWLVDNDKIDYDKAKGFKLLPLDTVIWFRLGENEKESLNRLNYYKLLMLLSIQDNPIEFLISILK